MFCVFENSIVLKLIKVFFGEISLCYQKSRLNFVANAVCATVRTSKCCFVLKKYADKYPSFLNSVIYKIIKKIVKGIDFIADKIHNIFASVINKSKTKSELFAIKNLPFNKKISCVGLFFSGAAIGVLMAGVISGDYLKETLYSGWIFFGLALFFAVFGKYTDIFEKSITFKFFKFLFELVKM